MLIIVLGGGINLRGEIPSHVKTRLDKALEFYKAYPNATIVTSGRYSFLYDQLGKYPPISEAKKMADYLLEKKIPKNKIIVEENSKDTIGNALYLKDRVFLTKNGTEAIIITSRFHLERVQYIFDYFFNKDYEFEYIGVEQNLSPQKEKEVINRQQLLLKKTKELLSNFEPDNYKLILTKLYTMDYYQEKRPGWVIDFVAQGK